MSNCKYFIVNGRVQGVYYRASTREMARKLGLTGWVRNMPDGRVEGYACGKDELLRQFEQWLHQGPPNAQVTEVQFDDASDADYSDFDIRY